MDMGLSRETHQSGPTKLCGVYDKTDISQCGRTVSRFSVSGINKSTIYAIFALLIIGFKAQNYSGRKEVQGQYMKV